MVAAAKGGADYPWTPCPRVTTLMSPMAINALSIVVARFNDESIIRHLGSILGYK